MRNIKNTMDTPRRCLSAPQSKASLLVEQEAYTDRLYTNQHVTIFMEVQITFRYVNGVAIYLVT
jgi:hypothetical protein